MVDKDAIYEDLLKAFAAYQYRLENPMPKADETEDTMRMRYRTDAAFNCRVKSLALGVMQILDKHL